MVKYEFVGAHDKGSENRGQRNKRWGGCEKNRGLQKKCGVRTPPPVYAYENILRPTRIYVWALYTT